MYTKEKFTMGNKKISFLDNKVDGNITLIFVMLIVLLISRCTKRVEDRIMQQEMAQPEEIYFGDSLVYINGKKILKTDTTINIVSQPKIQIDTQKTAPRSTFKKSIKVKEKKKFLLKVKKKKKIQEEDILEDPSNKEVDEWIKQHSKKHK